MSATTDTAAPVPARRSRVGRAMLRQFTRLPFLLGALFMIVVTVCAVIPGALAPMDPAKQSLVRRLQPPAVMMEKPSPHVLGTDQLGRDMLSRIIYGARVTLLVSLAAVVISTLIGGIAGLSAGYFGGRTDAIILQLIDILLAFPVVLLVMSIVAVLGPSIPVLVGVMGLSSAPAFARVVRASVIQVRDLEYIESARSIGAGTLHIITRHVVPNVFSAALVYATFDLSRMILIEATLSFLGLGVQPPTPTWGGMINEAQQYLTMSWTASFIPGLMIAGTILSINMIGDGLRDVLDPRLSAQ